MSATPTVTAIAAIGTDEAPQQSALLGLHEAAPPVQTPGFGVPAPRPGSSRTHRSPALIANAHQTCQCDRKPSEIKKVLVQPASTPNRHAASAPAATATGVNKSPNSDP